MHEEFHTPRAELDARLSALRARMAARDIDAVLVTHAPDLDYFSGTTQNATLVVRHDAEALLVRKSFERAREESALDDVRPAASIADIARAIGGARRAAACLDVWPAGAYRRLVEALPGVEWVDASGDVKATRAVKSEWELRWIREAAAQVNRLFESLPTLWSPEITELELSVRIESELRRMGHDGRVRLRAQGLFLHMLYVSAADSAAMPTKFDGPVASRGLHPRGDGASRRVIEPGDTVMIDVVTSVNGYQADNARTFAVGEPGDEAIRAHAFCRDALRELEKRLRPGAAPSTVYAEVAAWAADRGEPDGFMGYGANRVGFFGHGVGLELDEWPVIAPRFGAPIEAGMVVALEPKALSRAHGPAGVENTYVVADDGPVSLCTAPEEIVDLS